MTYGTGIGVYPFGEVGYVRENDEVSSTYEGRHLTFTEAQITGHEHDFPTKGHPVVVGENIVGVCFNTATAIGDQVTIDTEGIWLLSVVALNPAAVAVVAGDELFINKTTGIISNNPNKATHANFGYALGGVTAGNTAIIAVKVHWDNPSDALELVGLTGTPLESDEADIKFRQYYYEATGGGIIEGQRMELSITTTRAVTACVNYSRLMIAGDSDIIGGRSSVIEARLEILAGNQMSHTTSVMCLDWSCLNTSGLNNYVNAYCMLRDRTHGTVGQIRSLFHFMDHAALPEGGVTLGNGMLSDCNAAKTHNVSVTCTYGPALTKFWLMGTTTAPD